ncbi:MAG: hypothetical protein A2511_10215 [Deltaproteobacteria bacterium RIFOXYD12_FULL_50_9]|nr:MAG: hypothetical protein A2511_10215 [Deltaproteobacteria bacterium RIFOXYD12_FULL_50_9]
MIACRKHVTIKDPNSLVLSGLPFKPGQRVEVVLLAEEECVDRMTELRILLQETQSFPSAREISDDEITAEVEAYRTGQ